MYLTTRGPYFILASIAQLGERQTEDLKVTGSIPVGGSFLELLCVFFFEQIVVGFY